MTHLTLEQLLALREPGTEPGTHAAQQHLSECRACQAELDRLHQRAARLKALPTLRPSRDRFQHVRAQLGADRRRRLVRRASLGGLALAASVTLAVIVTKEPRQLVSAEASSDLRETMARSRQLENVLNSLDPDSRILDGRTAGIAARLENALDSVDQQIEVSQLLQDSARQNQQLRLWRQREHLLDALMDVHLTKARHVGL